MSPKKDRGKSLEQDDFDSLKKIHNEDPILGSREGDSLKKQKPESQAIKRKPDFDVSKYIRFWISVASLLFLLMMALNVIRASYFFIGLNVSESLPGVFYFARPVLPGTVEGRRLLSEIQVGSYIIFDVDHPYSVGSPPFLKKVCGSSGMRVEVRGREVVVGGHALIAKTETRKGLPLTAIERGVIPPGMLFACGSHKDSFDSRYKEIGLIPVARVKAVAYPF